MDMKEAEKLIRGPMPSDDLPVTEDMKVLAKATIPETLRKAYDLAMKTNRLGDVLAFLKEMNDRAYGKPAQSIEHTGKVEHVTLVLQRNAPVIDQEAKVIEDKT